MTMLFLELALMLAIILVAAELFTNALEHLGERLGISEGVTGSLFAAVGTALPETTVPIIALLGGTTSRAVNEEIGVGAILGAPLMLATLSTCLMTFAILKSRGMSGRIVPERSGFVRDLNFFLVAFLIACAAMFVPHHAWQVRALFAVGLVALYIVYVISTFKASAKLVEGGHGTEAPEALFASRLGLKTSLGTIMLQFFFGIVLLVGGAKGFIHGVEGVSHALGISALLLSLIIIPIATELPEKVNSILWARRGKDTLAFGNITGAMVFQGTLLPAIGIMLTPWEPRIEVLTGVLITLAAAAWLRFNAKENGVVLWALLGNGVLYAAYLALTLGR
ncbi:MULTISPECIES: sodium:calcium antiporter [Caballeronia]|jgi:cation:H+ antiporter|uniref:Sodium:proton exchanger n=1 Tax=Caballeronia zhejiangensis TaxID=871203 RepID=A0A656QPP0_9BURK|nr:MULTISPECIES: sodium:calcium antiporter [Caballeronia]KDR32908.1 sodium:proton exchanger [Caballeronia zhejiangensis]MCG7399574.1 sodium:calcium antiporter [Caballeronia zhejiangensis]MCI1041904.1 sodium:calcium antiporter [Caballeronia zhejiangensis]MDR5763927.1 sodium:calcium antiporter [Caballeronia sp. LZ028]MDR5785822.1 sodium:calcium antiporter [Caballeronia sp. LP003]